MTGEPLDLTPIEARDAAVTLDMDAFPVYTDRRALLAEVKRLRVQMDQLTYDRNHPYDFEVKTEAT